MTDELVPVNVPEMKITQLKSNTIFHDWLIDRIACGYTFEVISTECVVTYDVTLKEEDFEAFKLKKDKEIKERFEFLQGEIFKTNLVGKLTAITNKLYDLVLSDNIHPKEASAVAATLKGYLEMLKNFGRKDTDTVVKTQNNFVILQTLEKEKLITINEPEKLKRIIDADDN